MDKLSILETEINKLINFNDFLKEKIKKLEDENLRLAEHIKYIEEEARKDKKNLKEIKGNMQYLKVAREKLSGLLEKWNNYSSNWS